VPLIVISDASPIRALHHLGLLSLCRDLYASVIVPEAVRQELRQPTITCPALEITDHDGFEVRTPRSKPADLGVPSELDAGVHVASIGGQSLLGADCESALALEDSVAAITNFSFTRGGDGESLMGALSRYY